MLKKTLFLLFFCICSSTSSTPPFSDTQQTRTSQTPDRNAPDTRRHALLNTFTFFTNIQPCQLNNSNVKNVLVPIVALHALEHFGCGNSKFGRKLTGDTNNPNRGATLSLWIAAKLAFHVIPSFLVGDGFFAGVKGFINSGHLARMALVTPFRVENKGAYIASRMTSILLIANQVRIVNDVHKKVIQECKELGIQNPFQKAIIEPSPAHIKLPRYLTQDFGVFMAQWFIHRLIYKNHYRHFNKEFWSPFPHHEFWAERQLNPQLLRNISIFNNRMNTGIDEEMLVRILQPLLLCLGRLGSTLYGGIASILFSCFGPYNLFITKKTFEKLSQDLQNSIIQLNNQELIFNTYNLTNPLTERTFALAQYTYKTEAEDFCIGVGDNLSPESIRNRLERHAKNPNAFFACRLDYVEDNLYRIDDWEKTGKLPLKEEDVKSKHILNYKEQTLMNFIAINAETTREIRTRARRYAQEVLAKKPVSHLAKKVIALTADLEKKS